MSATDIVIDQNGMIEMPSGGANRGNGDQLNWLRARVDHVGDECLIWPFFRNHQGYGMLGYYGKVRKAHRIMCLLVNGEPPTPTHQAAHSCGNGHGGCVHPEHVSWKTPRQNRLDSNAHGTGNAKAPRRLTLDLVQEIRASGKPILELSEQYGIYFGTIGKILRGETWVEPRSSLTRDQVQRIKELGETGMKHSEIAKIVGVKYDAVRRLRIRQTFRGI